MDDSQKKAVADKAKKAMDALKRGKAAYQKHDALLDQILGIVQPGEPIELPDGRTVTVTDVFADRNDFMKTVFVKRYSLGDAKKSVNANKAKRAPRKKAAAAPAPKVEPKAEPPKEAPPPGQLF